MRRRGYTLIEMVATIVIVGLMTAAVGMGTRTLLDDSESRSAENNAQRVLLAEQTFSRRNGSYTAYTDDLGSLRDVTLTNGPSQDPTEVSLAMGVNGSLGIAVRRTEASCILLAVERMDGSGSVRRRQLPSNTCTGAEALPAGEAQDLDAGSTSRSRD